MTKTARVTVTLTNIASQDDIHNLEEHMSALSDAIAQLRTTVSSLSVAQSPEKVNELEAALQTERDANAALVARAIEVASAEELEDSEQQRALDEARATADELVAEMNNAAGDLSSITAQLEAVGTAVDQTPDETPVGEVPVEAPSDVAPAEGPTPDPSSPTTTDVGATPDGTAADEGPGTGGLTDASGNPVAGPNL